MSKENWTDMCEEGSDGEKRRPRSRAEGSGTSGSDGAEVFARQLRGAIASKNRLARQCEAGEVPIASELGDAAYFLLHG